MADTTKERLGQETDLSTPQELSTTEINLNTIVQQILEASSEPDSYERQDYYEERAMAFMGVILNLPADAQIEVEIEVPGAVETGVRKREARLSDAEIEERELVFALQMLLPSVGIVNTGSTMTGTLRVAKPSEDKPTLGIEVDYHNIPTLLVNPGGSKDERQTPPLAIPLKYIKPNTGIRLTKGKPLTRPPSYPR